MVGDGHRLCDLATGVYKYVCTMGLSVAAVSGWTVSEATAQHSQPLVLQACRAVAHCLCTALCAAYTHNHALSHTHLPTCRLKPDDPFEVNPVFTAVWNCMGLYPLIWASILVPGGRGEGKVSMDDE